MEYRELQFNLIKSVVNKEHQSSIRNSNNPVFDQFNWRGFTQFQSFVENSRKRRFFTAFPMTAKHISDDNFLELIEKYHILNEFNGQKTKDDLVLFLDFIKQMEVEDTVYNLMSYEIRKYLVSSHPKTAIIFKADYCIQSILEQKTEMSQNTYYLFLQEEYYEELNIFQIEEVVFNWLYLIINNNDFNTNQYLKNLTIQEKDLFSPAYDLIQELDILKKLQKESSIL